MLCVCRKRLSSPRCRSVIDAAWVVIVPGQKCIKNNNKKLVLAAIFFGFFWFIDIVVLLDAGCTPSNVIDCLKYPKVLLKLSFRFFHRFFNFMPFVKGVVLKLVVCCL